MTGTSVRWRKSSFSGGSGECVEVAQLVDGALLVRNSNHPGAGTLGLTHGEMAAWLAGCKAGDLDRPID